MYTLEICHPHDFLTDGWKRILTSDTDPLDELEFPSFNCSEGMLLRINDAHYVYKNGAFIKLNEGIGLHRWRLSHNPFDMFEYVIKIVSRERMHQVFYEIVKLVTPYADESVQAVIELVQYPVNDQWSCKLEEVLEDVRYHRQNQWSATDILKYHAHQSVIHAMRWLMGDNSSVRMIQSVLFAIGQTVKNQRKICDLLRSYISIVDIIDGITAT